MNINVVVFNVLHDFRPSDVRDHGRGRDERFVPTSSKPDTAVPVEEVIELMPRNGVWVGKGDTKAARAGSYSLASEPRAFHPSLTVTTYDHEGKVHRTSQDKGLRINITA
jgi:hypothetical protein